MLYVMDKISIYILKSKCFFSSFWKKKNLNKRLEQKVALHKGKKIKLFIPPHDILYLLFFFSSFSSP